MLNTDNFSTFLLIFPFQILFKVREKSESFQDFFGGKIFFCKTYARVTQSANSSYFGISLPSLIGSHIFAAISADKGGSQKKLHSFTFLHVHPLLTTI